MQVQSATALHATKRAVNRGADAAGFRTALYAGLDVVGPLTCSASGEISESRLACAHWLEIARRELVIELAGIALS